MDWGAPIYVAEKGQVRGPLSLRELRREFVEGRLAAETLYCRKAAEGWLSWEDLVQRLSQDFPEFLRAETETHATNPPIPPPRNQVANATSTGRTSAVTVVVVVGAVLGGLSVLGVALAVLLIVIEEAALGDSPDANYLPTSVEEVVYHPAPQQEQPFRVEARQVNPDNPVLGRMLVIVCRSERPIAITGVAVNGDPIPPGNLAELSIPTDIGSLILGLPDITQLKLPYRMRIGGQVNIQVPPDAGHLIYVDIVTDRGSIRYEFQ